MNTIRQQGFSLVELVMVIILLSVAAAALLQPFAQASRSMLLNEQMQIATQLAQERAESILATRRLQGYTHVSLNPGSITDTLNGAYSAYTRTLTITQPASSGCNFGSTCKEVVINVSEGASLLASTTLVLVDY